MKLVKLKKKKLIKINKLMNGNNKLKFYKMKLINLNIKQQKLNNYIKRNQKSNNIDIYNKFNI